MHRLPRLAAAAAAVLCASSASAVMLFENPSADGFNSACDFQCDIVPSGPDVTGAQAFALAERARVERIGFDFLDFTETGPGSYLPGSVDWSLRRADGNLPGAVIASGTAPFTADEITRIGTVADRPLVSVAFGGIDTVLEPGGYFATFDVDAATISPAVFWYGSSTGVGPSAESTDGGSTWQAGYGGEIEAGPMTLSVEGTPDPAPVPLPAPLGFLLAGLAGLGWLGWRRRAGPARAVAAA